MHRITPKVVALIVAVVAFATAAFAQPASDHLACYGVKDPVRKGPSTLTLMNASVTQSCRIGSRAQLVCLETETSNVVPTPRGGGPTPGNVGKFLRFQLRRAALRGHLRQRRALLGDHLGRRLRMPHDPVW